ncbi:MAG: hypothetical protein KA149_01095 [Chitinophagales bacterium]|nr:hypothetical protein [Chitinophagales bacterium]
MKTLLPFLLLGTFAISAKAQNTGNASAKNSNNPRYITGYSQNSCNCITSQQGDKIIVFSQGREMANGVTLSPGIKITADGRLKKEGGAERLLTDGNCVSERGTITLHVK